MGMLTARSVALADWRDAHLKVDSRANDLEVSPSIRGFLPLRRADRARARSARLVALQQGRDDVRRAIDQQRLQSAPRHDDVVHAERRTLSGAPSAYGNCDHGSTYIRFGSATAQG